MRQVGNSAGETLGTVKFYVRFVHYNHGPSLQGARQAQDSVFAQQVTGGVVWRTEEDEFDAGSAFVEHRSFVQRELGFRAQRNRHNIGTLNTGSDGIHSEGR